MEVIVSVARFDMGRLVTTPGARDSLTEDDLLSALVRHMARNWGELCEQDRELNDLALRNGGRLFSRFTSQSGTPFYVITEEDRSVTTFQLPEEY